MAPAAVVAALSWAIGIFQRLMASRRRNASRRRRLRHLAALVDGVTAGHRGPYCTLDYNVPIIRLWFNVEAELRGDFRLSRRAMEAVQRLLWREQDHGWGGELEVLIYVYWLAHALCYTVVARVFNVPKSTVHRIVHRVANHISRNLHRAISFPQPGDLQAVGQAFADLSGTPGFANIVGAIDGSHIRIKPPAHHRIDYINYKGFYSINLQAICDARGKFLDIFVGYPGSVHDTRVMKNSPVYRAGRYPPPGHMLLGDGGYQCLDAPLCVMTPYREPVNGPIQARYNYHHAKGRSIIERVFGMMKTRWRCTLFKALEVRPTFTPQVIASCAFLHNICMENGDLLEPDDDVARDVFDPQPPRDPLAINERPGHATRDRLAAQL